MKRVQELTKEELYSLILNNLNIKVTTKIECALCGNDNVKYYYICKDCQKLSKEK